MDTDANDYHRQADDGMDCGDSGIESNDVPDHDLLADAQNAFRRHVLSDAGIDMDADAESSGGGGIGGLPDEDGDLNASMCDTRSIPASDVVFPLVVAKIPSIYPNANEIGPDRVAWNLRAIPYDTFIERCKLVLEIVEASPEQQIHLSRRLMAHIISVLPASEDTQALTSLVDTALGLAYQVNSKTNYVDVTNRGLSFDRIVQYRVDEHDRLVVVPASYEGRYFYSQLATPEEVTKARAAMDDRDLYRAYRTIEYLTAMMTNQRDHLCPSISTFINLGLLLQCLVVDSIMIAGDSRNDLRASLVALIIDAVLRSRVTTFWNVWETSRHLVKDIILSHRSEHYIAQAMDKNSAEERFNLFKNSPNKTDNVESKELVKMLAKVDYRAYMAYLQSIAVQFDDGIYYSMDSRTFMYIMSMLPMDVASRTVSASTAKVGTLVSNIQSKLNHLTTAIPVAGTADQPPNKRTKFE